MVDKRMVGLLLVLILSGAVYVVWPDKGVKFRIDTDKSTFYMLMDGRYKVVAREYNSVWSGSTKLNRRLSDTFIDTTIGTNEIILHRTTTYQRGPVIVDTYTFSGDETAIEKFPLTHTIEIYNGSGYIYQYEVRDLRLYDGDTLKNIDRPLNIGKLTIEWDEGSYWNTLYKSQIFKARWRVTDDYMMLENRVFDPSAPVMNTSRIFSEDNLTETPLELFCNATDADGDNVSYQFQWYNEGVLEGELSFFGDVDWDKFNYSVEPAMDCFGLDACRIDYSYNNPSACIGGANDTNWSTCYGGANAGTYDTEGTLYFNYSIDFDWPPKLVFVYRNQHIGDNGTVQTNITCWSYLDSKFIPLAWHASVPLALNNRTVSINNSCIQNGIPIRISYWMRFQDTSQVPGGNGNVFYGARLGNFTAWFPEGTEINVYNYTPTSSGNYTLGCRAWDGTGSSSWLNSTALSIELHQQYRFELHNQLNDSLDQNFIPDLSTAFAQVNFSDNFTMQSGNFSWNITLWNVTTNTSWVYNLTNNNSDTFTIQVKLNQSPSTIVHVWFVENSTNRINLTTSYQNFTNLTNNQSKLVNVTIDLINISQSYVNWTLTDDNTNWKFNISFYVIA